MLLVANLLIIIFSVSCIEIKQVQLQSNLQWKNYTGASITPDMAEDYLNVIQTAATSYGAEVSLNVQYIQQKLSQRYGRNYQVVIDAFNKSSNFSWTLYSEEGYIVSWSNVNRLSPSWSYLIWTVQYNFPYVLINTTGHGAGIDSWDIITFNSIVSSAESEYANCSCDTKAVSESTGQFFDGLWSVVCSESPADLNYLKASISPVRKQWVYLRKKCGYIIYNVAND